MNPETFLDAWGAAMWRACWQGSILILLVWLLCRTLLRNAQPSTRAALWWLACLKCVAALAIGATIALPILSTPAAGLSAQNDRPPDLTGPRTSIQAIATPGNSQARGLPAQERPDWRIGLAALWLTGSVGVGIWILRQGRQIREVLQESRLLDGSAVGAEARRMGALLGLDSPPRVVESDRISAPLVVGLWRSTVILPTGFAQEFSETETHMALAHELAHVRRRDLMAGLVPTLCQLLFFFLPPMWVALREWSTEREAACDSEAVRATRSDPSGYSRMLMKIVQRDPQPDLAPALGATTAYYTIRKRLQMIQKLTIPGRSARALTAFVFALFLCFALPWQLTAQAAQQVKADPNNLVKNASFEEGDGGLASWSQGSMPAGADTGVTMTLDSSVKHSGKSSMRFEKSRTSFFPVAFLSQELRFDPSQKKIKLGMWVKAQAARKITLAVFFGGSQKGVEWGAYVGEANDGDSPATHDWKHYGSVLAIPEGTQSIGVAIEMYGPGTAWIDDLSAEYVPDSTPLKSAVDSKGDSDEDPLADVKDVPNLDLKAGHDPMKRYFQIGPKAGANSSSYKLLVVLPGGDGSADFNPFVRRIWKFALPEDYIVAELVAPKWDDQQFNQLVWPTEHVQYKGMRFSTEKFVDAVIKEVSKNYKVDPNKVFTLSWSSGGPAAYAAALTDDSIKGSFVAMSVFTPNTLPPFVEGQGRSFYILHSPQDQMIPMTQPQMAADELKKAGANTKLVTYEGGHGWTGNTYEMIRDGMAWLEKGGG